MSALRQVTDADLDDFTLVRKGGETKTTGGGWRVKLECGHVLRHQPMSNAVVIRDKVLHLREKRVRCPRCK